MLIRTACAEADFPRIREEVTGSVKASQEVSPLVERVAADHYAETMGDYKFKRFRDIRRRLKE
jgi:hypothetical protein